MNSLLLEYIAQSVVYFKHMVGVWHGEDLWQHATLYRMKIPSSNLSPISDRTITSKQLEESLVRSIILAKSEFRSSLFPIISSKSTIPKSCTSSSTKSSPWFWFLTSKHIPKSSPMLCFKNLMFWNSKFWAQNPDQARCTQSWHCSELFANCYWITKQISKPLAIPKCNMKENHSTYI